MRTIPTLAVAAGAMLALATVVYPQAPGGDTSSRTIRQAGAPSALANDSLFRRAERLVREGHGEAGRAVVDTLLVGTRPGSAQHAQALYWRASLAGDAAEAERGYRRVIVEYAATPWAGNALLNLSQLELARGDQEQALVHLYRFEREHPTHESRARASFWLARLHFDKKNEPRGCAALATARIAVSPADIELRNQIDYYEQRCIGVDTTLPPAHPVAAAPARLAERDSQPSTTTSDTAVQGPLSAGGYTVQVAAYDTRPPAELLIERLQSRGYTARLASSVRPFRVRIGRYDTHADAVAAQQRLKTKGIDGFVTEMEKH